MSISEKRCLKPLIQAGLVAVLMAVSVAPVFARQWTGYTYASVPSTAAVKGTKRMIQQIDQATHGKVDINLHLGGTLHIEASNITQATGAGVVQFAADGFFLGNVPIGGVLRLPLLINNDKEWQSASRVMTPYLQKGFAQQGVIYLDGYRYPMNTIFTTFPVHSLADLRGHKIRVTSPEQAYFIKQLGAVPVQLAGAEVPTSLDRGVIDGVITASAGGARKWHDLLKYNYRLGVSYFNSAIIVNKRAFDGLDASTQARIRQIVSKQTRTITEDFSQEEQAQENAQQKDGMKIVQPSAAAVAKAKKIMQDYWQTWAKNHGPEFVEALNKVQKAMAGSEGATKN